MFLPQPFSNGLARLPRNFFRGSLIPLPPFDGGRAATQSTSRGSLVVQYWPDYKMVNRFTARCWIAIGASPATRTSVKQYKGKRKKKRYPLSGSGNIFPQPIQRYFSLEGGQQMSDDLSLYTGRQSPYLIQTFTAGFLQIGYLKTV